MSICLPVWLSLPLSLTLGQISEKQKCYACLCKTRTLIVIKPMRLMDTAIIVSVRSLNTKITAFKHILANMFYVLLNTNNSLGFLALLANSTLVVFNSCDLNWIILRMFVW